MLRDETVRTGLDSAARLVMADSTNLSLGPNATLKLDRTVFNDEHSYRDIAIRLTTGAFRFVTGHSEKAAYRSPRRSRRSACAAPCSISCRSGARPTVVLQDGVAGLHARFQCIELTQPGDTAVITSWVAGHHYEDPQPALDLCRDLRRARGTLHGHPICGCHADRRPPAERSTACCAGADDGRIVSRLIVSSVLTVRVCVCADRGRVPPAAAANHFSFFLSLFISPFPIAFAKPVHPKAPRHRRPSPTPPGFAKSEPRPVPGSSGGSIGGLANQRFNQMITNRVLGTVLLGVNEQVNCSDCVSAFGWARSFSAGIHGRKELTPNLSLLAGIAYTQFSEGGYSVTSAPISAFALRYDFVDWGSSRPFFDVGAVLSPFEKVRYGRSYTTSLGAVSRGWVRHTAVSYGIYGRAGWISRLSPRDEVAQSIEVWQMWQRVNGYSNSAAAFNPFDASIATGTDRTNLVKLGGQWTHMLTNTIEGNINGGYVQSFASHSGIVATVTGDGTAVPTMGNQGWFEYGGRLGFRIAQGWVADLFVNGTLGPQPVGNTIHGGVGLRVNY